MKKYLLLIIAIFGSFSFVAAQNGRQEKIQALKVAFITQRLQLTPAEAEKFWPVYNQFENEIRQVRVNNRNGDVLDNEQKVLDIRKKYRPTFESILGAERLNGLYKAERDFRNVLIQRLKEQK
jgi:4-amino-4-deoxy-L-arabinose transferase-like glycosyltransferase